MARLTLRNLKDMKAGDPITAATAFDYAGIRLIEEAEIDIVVPCDWTLSTILLGNPTPAQVTVEHILFYIKAQARLVDRAFILAPMPFGSHETSNEDALGNATLLIKAGADAVKLEGAGPTIDRVSALSIMGIPCCGHLGYTPQKAKWLGVERVFGEEAEEAQSIYNDALSLEDAGAWGVVLHNVPERVASVITERTNLITIGAGGTHGTRCCNGQLVITHDLLGWPMSRKPMFSIAYANFAERAITALNRHVAEVQALKFPEPQHTFKISDDEFDAFLAEIGGDGR